MSISFSLAMNIVIIMNSENYFCEAQARVRQGSAMDGSQGERPQSLNPCLELTLKLVAANPPPTNTHLEVSINLTNGLAVVS